MEKQDLSKGTSKALKGALTPKNIKAGFHKTGIWTLDRIAAKDAMGTSKGFEASVDDTSSLGTE